MKFRPAKKCSVSGCDSNSSGASTLKFFCFPRNLDRLKLWKRLCANPALDHLSDASLRSHRFVCSRHFKSGDLTNLTRSSRIATADPSLALPSHHISSPNHCPSEPITASLAPITSNSLSQKLGASYTMSFPHVVPNDLSSDSPSSGTVQPKCVTNLRFDIYSDHNYCLVPSFPKLPPNISPAILQQSLFLTDSGTPSSSSTQLESKNYMSVSLECHSGNCLSPSLETPNISPSPNLHTSLIGSSPSTSTDSSLSESFDTAESTAGSGNTSESNDTVSTSFTLSSMNVTRLSQLSPEKKRLYIYGKKKEVALNRLRRKRFGKVKKPMSPKELCHLNPDDLDDLVGSSDIKSPALTTFLMSQIRMFGKRPKGRRWSINEKILALTFYKKSPKAYALMRSVFFLPSKRTLKAMINSVPFTPGINAQIFGTLSHTVSQLQASDRLCCLLFDEMSIREHLSYSSASDCIVGLEDHGSLGKSNRSATHALVFMVCGIVKKWKQPVAYYFSHGSICANKLVELIRVVLHDCFRVGLKVKATICDLGSNNHKAVKVLGSTKEKPVFLFEDNEIVTIFDPPHLLKCTRNMLMKYDVKFPKSDAGSLNILYTASWKDIEDVYQRDKESATFRLLHKLTDAHLHPKFFQKMNVSLAAQVLSHSVSATIMKDVQCGLMRTKAIGTAVLVQFLNRLFDSFNGTKPQKNTGGGSEDSVRVQLSEASPHCNFWLEAYDVVNNLKFIKMQDNKSIVFRPYSQDGWLVSIRGMQLLWKTLKNVIVKGKPLSYIVPRTFNQDLIENLFGSIRSNCGSNSNPTAGQFSDALKASIISNLAHRDILQGTNCELDNVGLLNNLKYFLGHNKAYTKNYSDDEGTHVEHEELISEGEAGLPEDLSQSAYVSGFIARKIFKDHACSGCRAGLIVSQDNEVLDPAILCKEYADGQLKLTYPSSDLVRTVGQGANILQNMMDRELHYDGGLVKTIADVIIRQVSFEWLKSHCAEHTDIISKRIAVSICRIGAPWWCKKKNREIRETAVTKRQAKKLKILKNV